MNRFKGKLIHDLLNALREAGEMKTWMIYGEVFMGGCAPQNRKYLLYLKSKGAINLDYESGKWSLTEKGQLILDQYSKLLGMIA